MASWTAGIEVVLFDFVGTLVSVVDQPELELKSLYQSLVSDGFNVPLQSFRDAYEAVYHRYREIRLREQREIGSPVWVAEALEALGFKARPDDEAVIRGVEAFFNPYLESMQPYPCVVSTLSELARRGLKLGLVSSFSYARVVTGALARFGLQAYFDAVVISQDVGWRKPNPRIFNEALRRLGVDSSSSALVGDEPTDDVLGAASVGMRTVLVLAPREDQSSLKVSQMPRRPDLIIGSICELPALLLTRERGAMHRVNL